MAFGDVLRANINRLSNVSTNKFAADSFWMTLRDIAVKEILAIYPHSVDSNIAIETYFDIMMANKNVIPPYFLEILPSNGQQRLRVINRNLWSSNAFHPDGLANQKEIQAEKYINSERRGFKITYKGVEEYVNKQ